MDIYAVLGELLYIISNYEKGRIYTQRFWSRKYIASLNESLCCMSTILQLMTQPANFEQSSLVFIKDFCKKNEFIIFPQGDLTLLDDIVNKQHPNNISGEDYIIVCKMSNIIHKCIVLLNEKNKRYKIKISDLLRAFHNLPRVFLTPSKTVYNVSIKSISTHEALLYASSYVDLDLLS